MNRKVKERWKPIEGYPDYFVSNKGRVFRRSRIYFDSKRNAIKRQRSGFIKSYFHGSKDHLSPYVKLNRKLFNLKNLVGNHWIPGRDKSKLVLFRNPKDPSDCSIHNIYQSGEKSAERLNVKAVREIKEELRKHGHEKGIIPHLAKIWGVSYFTILHIKNGTRWKHVD